MKNYLTLVLTLAVLSTPAFASRARLESLGQAKDGSYYVDDSRNMFLNPAQLSNYKKKLWLEYGSNATTGITGQEQFGSSLAQGGFSNTFGDYTYAVYVNRQSDRVLNTLKLANSILTGSTLIAPDKAFELFIAGEGSVKWGIDLYYAAAMNKGATNIATTNVFAVKLGVVADKLEAFTTVGITSSAKNDLGGTNNSNELKGKFAIDLGLTYAQDNAKYKANFSTFGSTLNQLGTDTVDATTMIAGLGAGWKKEVGKSVTMWSIVGVDYEKDSAEKGATLAPSAVMTVYNIPLTLAAEAQATSWLTVRGSLSHSILGQKIQGLNKDSVNGVTAVAAGVGMTFGDVQIDGVVGSSASTVNSTGGYGYLVNRGAQSQDTFGFGNNFISRMALTYNF